MPKKKTPEYTARAIRNYNAKKDRITLLLDKGTKDKVEQLTGEKVTTLCKAYIDDLLNQAENKTE